MSVIILMSSLTGFMQFVADDKKNIKALVNIFFIGTEQPELLICLFELPSHCIYKVCLCVDYVLLMNINNIILCMFGLALTVKGKEGFLLSFGSRCQMLLRRIMRSFRSQFLYLKVLKSTKSKVPHKRQKYPQQYGLVTDWLWSGFAIWELRPGG